ncbi:hypothetical protein VCR3J2_420106 [Vibrio coralliirubri]|nr:hypothetical protein VCR3J2_420106 [Vibrio coralliirubri]
MFLGCVELGLDSNELANSKFSYLDSHEVIFIDKVILVRVKTRLV